MKHSPRDHRLDRASHPPEPSTAGSIQHLVARAGEGPASITFSRRNGAIYLSVHLTWQEARARLLEGFAILFSPGEKVGGTRAPSEPALAPGAKLWNCSKRSRFWGNKQPGKTLNLLVKWKVWRRPWLQFGICLWDLSAGELMSTDTRLPSYPMGASSPGACAGTRRDQFSPRLPRHHRGFICKAEPKQIIRVCCCVYGFGFYCLGTC